MIERMFADREDETGDERLPGYSRAESGKGRTLSGSEAPTGCRRRPGQGGKKAGMNGKCLKGPSGKLGSGFVTLAALLALAPSASAVVGGDVLGDVDKRSGRVAPTAAQRQAVSGMGAEATWNDFGTPASLIRHGGYLATSLSGADAATVARSWVNRNRALFRLGSVDGLRLASDSRLQGSNGYAVVFEQEFGGLRAAEDGKLIVGVVGTPAGGWKVAYASSSVTGDSALSGARSLSAQEAWLKAAADIGRGLSVPDLRNAKSDGDWTIFGVRGIAEAQRARLVALPTPRNGVRTAWETVFVDNDPANVTAYVHFVDAETGAVLVRKNVVEHSHLPTDQFSGAVPATDGACDSGKGPWTIGSPPGDTPVGSIVVSVEAHLTTNDVVLHLKRDGEIVASQDTLFSPEALVYAPEGGVPPGTYTVDVCDFGDGVPWDEPNTYSGQITFNPAGPGTGLPYPPMWKVFPGYPLLGNQTFPWNYPNTDTRKLWCWEDTVGFPPQPVTGPNGEPCAEQVQNLASRFPWDVNPRTGTPTFTTSGNNAQSAEAWTSPLTPGPPSQRPVAPDRKYVYDWTNAWHRNQPVASAPPGCSEANFRPAGNDIFAAVTNLFAMHNRMHDWSYFLGFTERRWNAQESNFGQPTLENDSLIGNAQAGAVSGGSPSYLGRDNANMIPLQDGVRPITNMYLWQPLAGAFYAPCVDGDYDMAVIGHEFGHLTENRMIGKGGTRGGHHGGAMGESFGDFSGAEYLNEYGYVPVSGENPFAVGAYVTGNKDSRDPQLRDELPADRRLPGPGRVARPPRRSAREPAELQRSRLRPHRRAGARRR
jgi:extracellular elastinolytic metalloproteinase